ncbi:MAG: class I SAM-dependent methyltransferase [Egibacteraceae bacterium]
MSRQRAGRRHRLFAWAYPRLSTAMESRGAGAHRDELLAGLRGRVVEIGAGNGLNFAHYPATVGEVIAVEPEPWLRTLAQRAAHRAPVPVHVVEGVAEHLPGADGSCDAGVVSLVLCSVAVPATALAELRRVVRPGGQLRFYEHVRADTAAMARVQDALDVVWPRLAAGCHTGRDSVAAIADAGFVVEEVRRFRFPPGPVPVPLSPHALGRAHRREEATTGSR